MDYSKANFSVNVNNLESIITDKNEIMIKCSFQCYCYYRFPRPTEWYLCKSITSITGNDIVKCLIDNDFDPNCDHRDLDMFFVDSPVQISTFFNITT